MENEDDSLEIGCSVYLDWPACQHKVECPLCGEPIRSMDEFVVLQPGKFDVDVVSSVVEFPLKTDQEDNPGIEIMHQDCWCNQVIDDDEEGLIAYIADVPLFEEDMPVAECCCCGCPILTDEWTLQINYGKWGSHPSFKGAHTQVQTASTEYLCVGCLRIVNEEICNLFCVMQAEGEAEVFDFSFQGECQIGSTLRCWRRGCDQVNCGGQFSDHYEDVVDGDSAAMLHRAAQ